MRQRGFTQHHCSKLQSSSLKNGAGFTLIEILIVIGIIALLAGIVLVAINPARQFAQARNTERTAHVNAVLNAIGQYQIDHLGDIPEEISDSEETIAKNGADICADLVPVYMAAFPRDPAAVEGDEEALIDEDGCADNYDTGYAVERNSNTGRITVSAPLAGDEASLGDNPPLVSVTR